MNYKRTVLSLLVPVAMAGYLPATQAQDGELFLEEIIVTARKKDESLQDVPLSVSAFSAAQIERRGYRDLHDIAQATSGLEYENFSTSGLSTAPVIRGMGQTFTTSRIQNTGVFLDGIYMQRQSMVNPGLLEVERIEVLKGPQNAQYGRNAFSGAINYITKQPSREFSGNIGGVVGDGERRDLKFALSGPLIADRLYGRIAAGKSEYDGHTDNDHPFANDGPGGKRSTDDTLGGWDDKSYALGLDFEATESLTFGLRYNKTESFRESQSFYYLDGARYKFDSSGELGGPPDFGFTGPTAANCLFTSSRSVQIPFPATGNHAWCGELPYDPPVLEDELLEQAGFGDTRDKIVVDPRSHAMDSESEIFQFTADWQINEDYDLHYQYGRVEHEASGFGTAPGRSSLIGSLIPFAPVEILDEPPFIVQRGFPGSNGAVAAVATLNANPVESLEADSHEIRLNFHRDRIAARLGVYYSKNEDEDGGTFWFLPPCNSVESCSTPVAQQPNPLDGTFISVSPDPDNPGSNIGNPHPFDGRSGVEGNFTQYEDKVLAIFGDFQWDWTERLALTVEWRYTEEDKSYEQLSSTFGFDIPDNVDASGDKKFTFFTPRVTLDWALTDDSMLYGLIAQGVKTGGFNAVDPSLNPDQATYDEEKNTTFEIGSKNVLFGGKLTLNAAVYYIDWEDVQGTEAASSPDAWTTDVVGNIGDAEVTGFELDGAWLVTKHFSIDYALAYIDPEYKDAVYQSSVAGDNSSWACNDIECRSDGRVDGNQVERTSKEQASVGFNLVGNLGNDWRWDGRIDFNYRSKMYATPLNLAHNGSRTISNANLSFSNGNLDITLWGKNIFNEEYVANSFVLPSFSRYIVSQGAPRTVGLNINYNW